MGQYLTLEEMALHFPKYFKNCTETPESQDDANKYAKTEKDTNCDFDYQNLEVMEKFFNDIGIVELKKSLESGFNVATRRGPLCGEEMFGTMFVVEDFRSIEYQKHKRNLLREEFLKKNNKKDKTELGESSLVDTPQKSETLVEMEISNPFETDAPTQNIEKTEITEPEAKEESDKTTLVVPQTTVVAENTDTYGPLPG